MKFVWRGLRALGLFWWDFLVGDTPEIAVAVVVILGVVTLISVVAGASAVAVVVLPLLVTTTLIVSVRRAIHGNATGRT